MHGCIKSTVPNDINRYLSRLHDIAIEADEILRDRLSKISSLEEEVINQLAEEREVVIKKIMNEGHSQMKLVEDYYRRIIEQFIAKLELQMSKHLDSLQQQVEDEKKRVFSHTNSSIHRLTENSQTAKRECVELLQTSVESKRQEILSKTTNISMNKPSQSFGYEQLRKLTLEIYSTVDIKEDGHGCDNISNRHKFIKDINDAKPNQPVKRTVYVGSSGRPL